MESQPQSPEFRNNCENFDKIVLTTMKLAPIRRALVSTSIFIGTENRKT